MNAGIETITDEHKQAFERDGFFVLEGVIPPEHLQMLRDEAHEFMKKIHADMDRAGKDVLGINHRNSRYFIAHRYRESGRLREFIFSDLMADICRATLGPTSYLFHEQYVIKAAERGMKFAWHQDSGYVGHPHREYVSCWCALDDMSEENGTVYMLPYGRAGVRNTVEHKSEAGTNDRVGYFGADPGDPVICPAGSIAVFSSNCFHRSGTNTTPRMRRVYLPQYSAEPIMNREGTRPHALADLFCKDGEKVNP